MRTDDGGYADITIVFKKNHLNDLFNLFQCIPEQKGHFFRQLSCLFNICGNRFQSRFFCPPGPGKKRILMAFIVINPMRKQGLQFLLKGQFMDGTMVMAVGMTRAVIMGMPVVVTVVVVVTVTVVFIMVVGMRVVVVVIVVMCHNITPFKYFSSLTGSGVN